MITAMIEYMGKTGYSRREQSGRRKVCSTVFVITPHELCVGNDTTIALRYRGRKMLVFLQNRHKLRWYHGFSRPFGERPFFMLLRKASLHQSIHHISEKENVT